MPTSNIDERSKSVNNEATSYLSRPTKLAMIAICPIWYRKTGTLRIILGKYTELIFLGKKEK